MLPHFLKKLDPDTPTIICLCGSTRFYKEFQQANFDLTMHGHIVLSVGCFRDSPEAWAKEIDEKSKKRLDELHLRKIELSDGVLFLNAGGYIGESTKRELAYAIAKKKEYKLLEPEAGEKFLDENSHEIGRMAGIFMIGRGLDDLDKPL